jgi:hypothetical protein
MKTLLNFYALTIANLTVKGNLQLATWYTIQNYTTHNYMIQKVRD